MSDARPQLGPPGVVVWALAALTAACGPTATREAPVAAWLPVTRPLVDSVEIVPPVEHSGATLGLGWPGALVGSDEEELEEEEDGTWRIRGRVATFTFQVAHPADRLLEAEIRAQGDRDDPQQSMDLLVNGVLVERRQMIPRWSVEEFEIPASALRVGVNDVRLEFLRAQAPPGTTGEVLPVPARVRWLRIRPPAGRPPWPTPPPAVTLTGEDGEDAAVPGIVMRSDSLLELAIPGRPATRLRGRLDAQFARGNRAGEIEAVVEIAGAGGDRELTRVTFRPGDAVGHALDLALDPGAADPFLLRLRVRGSANGQVRWHDLRLVHGGDVIPEPVGDPEAELRAAPTGGALLGPEPDATRPDILVILLDAARADAFGVYGGDVPTPAVDSLAQAGTRVGRAIAPSSWTEPSVPSLLTGLYPDVHGVEIWNWPLAPEIVTLPEILAGAGYRTVLWSHHLLWRGNRSLHQGFEVLETVSQHERQLLPDTALLVDDERPTFALVHLLLPHGPYDAPAPFRDRYADPDSGLEASVHTLGRFRQRFGDEQPSAELIAHARARYAEMVAWTDAQVDEILDGLRQQGRYDDAWIILTADHGEGFYEHGQFLHARFLYDEVLQVPLVLKWPAAADARMAETIDGPVSLIDLPPTILDALAIEAPEVKFQGRSLMPRATGAKPAPASRPVYAVTRVTELAHQEPRPQIILEHHGLKAYLDEPTGRLELYDLRADPGETRNLVTSRPLDAAFMLQELLAQRRRNNLLRRTYDTSTEAFELDEQMLENLRALGYIQ